MSGLYQQFLSTIIGLQQEINLVITDSFDKLESGNNSMYLYILLISFVYGLVHALGPGHGKMVIASYFLVKKARMREAFKAGFLTAAIHTATALSITLILYFFFNQTITKYFQEINANMYKVSAVFIISIALFLLCETIKDRKVVEKEESVGNKNIFTIALSIGVVPCPGVMTIVFFSMILGYIYLGVLSAITMSIGMGISISLAAIITSKMKNSTKSRNISTVVNYVGVAVLLSVGGVLLI